MNKIEKLLEKEKQQQETMKAPDALEYTLRAALDKQTTKKPTRRKRIGLIIAAALSCMIVVGYQFDALAFYGKTLFGFDEILSSNLQELNEQGMGQVIGQQVAFPDGTIVTIDGIMADANQSLVYYTASNRAGIDFDIVDFSSISGFATKADKVSGTAVLNDKSTELKGMQTFEAVSPFAKKLTIHFRVEDDAVGAIERSITFPYKANDALQKSFKQRIGETVKVDQGSIVFQKLIATPTMTRVEGKVKVDGFDRVDGTLSGIQLIANGEEVTWMGSGHSTGLNGRNFELNYDVLPQPLHSLELIVDQFPGYEPARARIPLDSIEEDYVMIHEKKLKIMNIAVKDQETEITIATEPSVLLDGVSLETNNERFELKTTKNMHEQDQHGETWKVRTLIFDTTEPASHLVLEGYHYLKQYNQKIELKIK